MLLLYQIILWLSQLAFVTTPMLKSLPFDLIRGISPATNFIGLLSGATDSLPRLPIADYIPVLNMSGFWYQRSDLTDSVSFQVAFIPTMAAIVLAIVLVLLTHIHDEGLEELSLERIGEELSARIDAIHIQVSRDVTVTSPRRTTRKPSPRKGNSIPLRVVHISRHATTCLNNNDDNARELELDALVGFKTYGPIPSTVTAPIESLDDLDVSEYVLDEYQVMAPGVEAVVADISVSGDPIYALTPPSPSMIPKLAPITTSSHETAVQQSEGSGYTPTTPGETENVTSGTPESTSSDVSATTPDLPTPSAFMPDSELTGVKIDIEALLASAPAPASSSSVDEQPRVTLTDKISSGLFSGHRESEDHSASRESKKDTSISSTDAPSSSQSISLPRTDSHEISRFLSPPEAPTTSQTQSQENPVHDLDYAPEASPARVVLSSESIPPSVGYRKIDATDGDNSDAQPSPSPITPSVYHPVDARLIRRRLSLPDLRMVSLAELDDTDDSPVNRVVFRERASPDFRLEFFNERRRSDSPTSEHCRTVESSPVKPISEDESDEILSKLLPAREVDYDADESDFEEDDDEDDDWDFQPKSNAITPAISLAPASTPAISSDPARTVPTALSSAPASIIPTSLLPTLPTPIPRPRVPYAPLKKPGTYRELWDAAHAAHSKGQNWLAARLLPERFLMFWSPTARSWADEVEEDMFREVLKAKLIGEGGRVRTAEELSSPRADEIEEDMPREAFEVKLMGEGGRARTAEELSSPR